MKYNRSKLAVENCIRKITHGVENLKKGHHSVKALGFGASGVDEKV
jgi:hypothetical protein